MEQGSFVFVCINIAGLLEYLIFPVFLLVLEIPVIFVKFCV